VKTGFRVFSKTQIGIHYNPSKGHLFYRKKNYPFQVSMLLQDVVTHRGDNTDSHHGSYKEFLRTALYSKDLGVCRQRILGSQFYGENIWLRDVTQKLRGFTYHKFQRQRHKLGAPGYVRLAEDTTDVGFNRLFTATELVCNFPVHESLGNKDNDLPLFFA